MSALDDKIAQLTADVTAVDTEVQSAVTFINGVPGLVKTAVDAALAAGATATQLQSLTDLATKLETEAPALASAITANTPSA